MEAEGCKVPNLVVGNLMVIVNTRGPLRRLSQTNSAFSMEKLLGHYKCAPENRNVSMKISGIEIELPIKFLK
jgi:hypothetical protein